MLEASIFYHLQLFIKHSVVFPSLIEAPKIIQITPYNPYTSPTNCHTRLSRLFKAFPN